MVDMQLVSGPAHERDRLDEQAALLGQIILAVYIQGLISGAYQEHSEDFTG